MIFRFILMHALIYGSLLTLYLFFIMRVFSPRIWGYHDYPQEIKDKVPPQTQKEFRIAALISIPLFLFGFIYPIYTTMVLKSQLGSDFSVWYGFLHLFSLFLFANLLDFFILDWLIITKITPNFVIIPGTEPSDYQDFRNHLRGHIKSVVFIVPILLITAIFIHGV